MTCMASEFDADLESSIYRNHEQKFDRSIIVLLDQMIRLLKQVT